MVIRLQGFNSFNVSRGHHQFTTRRYYPLGDDNTSLLPPTAVITDIHPQADVTVSGTLRNEVIKTYHYKNLTLTACE